LSELAAVGLHPHMLRCGIEPRAQPVEIEISGAGAVRSSRAGRTPILGLCDRKAFISGARDCIVVAGTRLEGTRMNGGHIGRSLRRLEDPRFLIAKGVTSMT